MFETTKASVLNIGIYLIYSTYSVHLQQIYRVYMIVQQTYRVCMYNKLYMYNKPVGCTCTTNLECMCTTNL